MRFISVAGYSSGSWATHVTFDRSGVPVDHCRCQQTKIWSAPGVIQSSFVDWGRHHYFCSQKVSEPFPLIRYDIVREKMLLILRTKWVRLREAPTEAFKSGFVRGKIFLVWCWCLALLTFKSCLVSRPHYSAWARRFRSRGPRENAFCPFALDTSMVKWIDRKGLGKYCSGTREV